MSDPNYIPETATIKEAIQHQLPEPMAKEALRIFNRWYSRELAEAREEGRQAGVAEERERVEHGFIVFEAPYEYYVGYQEAYDRLEELADEEHRYGTLLKVASNHGDALGFTVKEPIVDVARAANVE